MPTAGKTSIPSTICCLSRVEPGLNHPSGGLEPSSSDINITAQLKAAGAIVGIELLDHIIFNRTGYFSFLEAGRL